MHDAVTYRGDIITKENVVCCGSVHVQKYYKGLLCTGRAGQGKSIQPRGCIFYPSPNYPTMEHIYQSHCDIKYTVLVLQVEIGDMFVVQYLEYSGNMLMRRSC